jgi:hypothetical protein
MSPSISRANTVRRLRSAICVAHFPPAVGAIAAYFVDGEAGHGTTRDESLARFLTVLADR